MRRAYLCPVHRNTCCRCGRRRPASSTLVTPVVVLSLIACCWIRQGLKALVHVFTHSPSLWIFPVLAVMAVVGYVLIMANSAEIRNRERRGE